MLGLSKISWLALAALLLVSCPFSGGDEAPGEDAARLPPPNPLDVSIRADPTNATTKVLGSDGGTLAITLADGTNVELDVPPGALPLATRIGIAPVDSIDGWEFEPTGIAAVQLSPDGLEFFVPATLTFERSSTEPPSANGQISWKGEGTDLHPVLGSALSNGVTIPIEHFSGYGFVWNLDMGYWGQWEQFRGRTWEAYLEQELAAILASDQQKQFLGIEEEIDLDALVMSRLTHWYDWVYTSLMAAAGTSCAAGRAAAIAQTFLARKIALMGADIHELWQRFSDARRERGHPLPYTFDGLPFDFVDRLVATCDREALEACQLTGDLGLLMVYIRDRNNLLEVAGNRVFDPSAPSADDGSDLIERCGRYHVDFDATFADDRVAWELPGQRGHPLSHERNRWRLQLSVDLRWERVVGAVPWVGRMVGEAVPEWTGLGAQRRSFVAHQNDQGEVTGGWAPWCVWGFGIGPWKPWPVELKGLDFARERVQEELPKPPPAIQYSSVSTMPKTRQSARGPPSTSKLLSGRHRSSRRRSSSTSWPDPRCTIPAA
ncbi:MAG: hypothetical protein ACXWXS_02115 [Actinomycetota bacterium]